MPMYRNGGEQQSAAALVAFFELWSEPHLPGNVEGGCIAEDRFAIAFDWSLLSDDVYALGR